MKRDDKVRFLTSAKEYFAEVVHDALEKRRVQTTPIAADYLVNLLDFYVTNVNLNTKLTFAEMLLQAQQAEKTLKIEKLKQVGDTSLYITGFFGDSLRRKIVDLDYYAEIGGMAYINLAHEINDEPKAELYYDFSKRFNEYLDVLTYISQNSLIQTNQDLLRLYERYVTTGSELAKYQLVEKGLIVTDDIKKISNQ
jgi:hypothetical protein